MTSINRLAPAACPAADGKLRAAAHREFPSQTKATCLGVAAALASFLDDSSFDAETVGADDDFPFTRIDLEDTENSAADEDKVVDRLHLDNLSIIYASAAL